MPLSLNYKFLLVVSLLSSIVSALLNLIVTNLLWANYTLIPLWGQHSVTIYLVTFSIISSFIMVWIVTKATRSALKTKQILPLHWHLKSQTLIDQLPTRTVPRAFILSVASTLMTVYTLYLLNLKGVHSFYSSEFYAFSTVYYILQAAAVALMAIYRAMGDKVMQHAKV